MNAANSEASCSSLHVECTKTWLRILALCVDFWNQTAKPHSSCRIRSKRVRAAVTDDWARCDTRKNLSLVLPLAAFRFLKMGRENQQACLYTAFKRKSYSLSGVLEFQWKQQATLASLCRDWPNIVWTCLWPTTENETFFVELWHVCYTKHCVKKFCGGKIN